VKEYNNIIKEQEKLKEELTNYSKYDYKNNIKSIKNNLNQKIKDSITSYFTKIEDNYLKEIKNTTNEQLTIYKNELYKLEEKRNNEFKEKEKENNELKKELYSICELNNMIHKNKICKKCENPIKGILYKCCECEEYYLCEKCEEMNYIDKLHPHYFIKIRKNKIKYNIDEKKNDINSINLNKHNRSQNNESFKSINIQKEKHFIHNRSHTKDLNNIKINKVNDIEIENNNSINYETNNNTKSIIFNNLSNQEITLKNSKDFDINNFSFDYKVPQIIFSKKDTEKKISLEISNNGKNTWMKNKMFLKMQNNDYFYCEINELKTLKPNESEIIEINLHEKTKKLQNEKEIILFFDFYIKIGNPINIPIKFHD
jgi:hypothetical protein